MGKRMGQKLMRGWGVTRGGSAPALPPNQVFIDCSWCSNPEISKLIKSTPKLPALQETKQLLKLPESYSVLVKDAAAFQCPQRLVDATYGDDGQATMLCLLCGAMLCTNSYCCQVEVEKENTMGSEKRRIGGFTQHVQT